MPRRLPLCARPFVVQLQQQPFYGAEIRLLLTGYVRPEANFSSLEALIARIHKDADEARAALEHPAMQRFAADAFLQPGGGGAAAAAQPDAVAAAELEDGGVRIAAAAGAAV